jgi:putative transposase
MAGTYTQLYIHIIFSVKSRKALIDNNWKARLFSYIASIIDNKGHKSFIVNGVADHVHILISVNPSLSLSSLVRDVKNNSAKFVNENKLCAFKFGWQEGYAAFSCSKSVVSKVYQYIENQEEHHRKLTFKQEYEGFIKQYGIEYQPKYLFDLED